MWHETKEELMEFLKSILRLDEDQCARRMAMKYVQLNKDDIDKEYYDLESKSEVPSTFEDKQCSFFKKLIFFSTTHLLATKVYVKVQKRHR